MRQRVPESGNRYTKSAQSFTSSEENKGKDMITNKIVRERTGQDTLESIIRERRLIWFGHAYRMDSNRIARQVMDWIPPDFKKKRGRPRVTWTSTIKKIWI